MLSNDLRASGIGEIESLKAAKVQSLICVPIQAFDRRVGVIYADTSDLEARFDQIQVELLTAVGATAAMVFEHAAQVERLEAQNSRLQHDLGISHDLVGASSAMAEVIKSIAKIAPANSTVLIRGESGTGKELVARAIHNNSPRAGGPFVAINCATLTETLLESELFGHEKGAFTGAIAQKKGLFEIAAGGTVFLDEIGEMPLSLQAKLLRVLQERECQRIGGTRPVKLDVRIIAATHRDLSAGEFRQDLYYRLNVVGIEMPPLRDHREDILPLARHFLQRLNLDTPRLAYAISPAAERILENYDWPGNVRQLQNAIERAVVLGSTDTIRPEDLPAELIESGTTPDPPLGTYNEMVNAAKRDILTRILAKTNGNLKEAAEILDLAPTYIYTLLKNLKMTHLLKPR